MERKKKMRAYHWLTKKYQMIIRNEADFSEKSTISYNYGKAIMFLFFVFTLSAITGFFCISYIETLFNGRDNEKDLGHEVVRMGEEIDSLTVLTKNYRDNDQQLRELMGLLNEEKSVDLK
tara:strand:- start:4395 stop:4754 length:360 start_codon:yes stop_codon:yes gene_type:complete